MPQNTDEIRDHDQFDVPPGTDPKLRTDAKGFTWFNYGGNWYQCGANMPPAVRQAWLAEELKRDREEKSWRAY